MEPLSYVYMNCTKNEWGRKVIEEWNKVLTRIKSTEEYRRIIEIGYTGQEELDMIRENYDAFMHAH
jgi:hypothetical protein